MPLLRLDSIAQETLSSLMLVCTQQQSIQNFLQNYTSSQKWPIRQLKFSSLFIVQDEGRTNLKFTSITVSSDGTLQSILLILAFGELLLNEDRDIWHYVELFSGLNVTCNSFWQSHLLFWIIFISVNSVQAHKVLIWYPF